MTAATTRLSSDGLYYLEVVLESLFENTCIDVHDESLLQVTKYWLQRIYLGRKLFISP